MSYLIFFYDFKVGWLMPSKLNVLVFQHKIVLYLSGLDGY